MSGKADLHVHTSAGDGLDDLARVLAQVAAHTDLDVLAITEHDNLAVAMEAREQCARKSYGFDVVPGMEVTTLEGHLLALFIEQPVPSLRRVEETIEAVHRQGGLCVVPHPMSWLTRSIGPGAFERVAAAGLAFDAIELETTSPFSRRTLPKARRLNAERYHLPHVGASDAHFATAVGTAWTSFDGATAAELKVSIEAGAVHAGAGNFPPLSEVGWARALSLPLTGLRATPKALGWRRTAWSFVGRYGRRPAAGRPT